MNWIVAVVTVCVFVPSAHCLSTRIDRTTWATIATKYCNGSRQSPINIVSASAQVDSNLTAFTFHNYSSKSTMKTINNTDYTVKVILDSGVRISGGGLSDDYDSLQFHFHWGNGTSVPGSEHTVDGKRYPMELHIVNIKASYNRSLDQASADSTGIAALGFLIEEMSGNATGQPASWNTLSSYLTNISNRDENVTVAHGISLDDLLTGVDRTKYYRYLGSLTTPNCSEAVVWTVFKDTIKVSKDVIDLFSKTVRISDSTSPFMINVYRNTQPAQRVTTQAASSTSKACYSLVLMALSLVLGRS
ncbi:hypothetical protein EPR50_G00214690 [Perca flavescens]|uniref:Carbonic anhydrase n=1 Tax=Perca flavescens TaxID=8167 RepID=A0A484C2F4_PERFV|nr:hypothetical protein EPR50_G00214690 [Perca flavescens]